MAPPCGGDCVRAVAAQGSSACRILGSRSGAAVSGSRTWMCTTAAPAVAASSADSAIASGLTGTAGFFRGVSKDAFDGRGNYSLGIREQVIFPEIDYNSIDRLRGLQVVIVATARTDAEGQRLLDLLGMPFAMEREALSQV